MEQNELTIESIFLAAAELREEAARSAYLDQVCGSDESIRQRVERLLAAQAKSESFLETPALGVADLSAEATLEGPGTVIGPYHLMEQIGEGGMGLVFVAEQRQPLRRKVALKVIKPGMDSRQVVARFEAERQALAMMDHPNIAKVYDGGTTPPSQGGAWGGGRPYFVMELVKGAPISAFCDDKRLSTNERLNLFVSVCDAVQHAHQKGIIHRDLKPSNVLVALHDGTPVVKVIDFGVAKAIDQPLTDKTVYTQFAQMLGTPLYMAPEQAADSGLDVDTRSDIYSLGVLLYELLTGTTPFDKDRLRKAGFDEMRRIIREEEAPRPSARISTLGDAAHTVSANRMADPRQLRRLIRGDLDWIVLKALEKDRNRRFDSASALAADVRRYLRDEPVLACPPSSLYQFKKFVRRHKTAWTAGALIGAAFMIALVSLIVSNIWVMQERQEVIRQRDDAKTQRRLARQAVDKMYTQVAQKWLAQQPRLEPLQKEFLEDALHFYQQFAEEPSADPEMRVEAAEAYRRTCDIRDKLGDSERAIADVRRAIHLFAQLTDEFPDRYSYRAQLGDCRLRLGGLLRHQERLEEAEKEFRESLRLQEECIAACPNVPDYRFHLAQAWDGLAGLHLYCSRPEDAVDGYRRAIAVLEDMPKNLIESAAWRFHLACDQLNLGWALWAAGSQEEALESAKRGVPSCEKLVAELPDSPNFRFQLTHTLLWVGSKSPKDGSAQAEAMLRRAVAIQQKLVADFPAVPNYRFELLECYNALGELFQASHREREADEAFDAVVRLSDELVNTLPPSPAVGIRLCDLRVNRVTHLIQSGRIMDAARLCRNSLPIAQKLADTYPSNPRFQHYLGLSRLGMAMELGKSIWPE